MTEVDVGVNVQELTRGRNDYADVHANAVVSVNNGCTGTLVGASLVLTAGHCSGAGLPHSSRIRTGEWMDLNSSLSIFFGNDSQSYVGTRTVTQFNYAGFDDIILLKLDRPVSPTLALPARVLTRIPGGEAPADFLGDKRFQMVGWGGTGMTSRPRFRQRAAARLHSYPFTSGAGVVQPNMLRVRGEGDATVIPGDSGSPLIYNCHDPAYARYPFVVGVAQGTEAAGGRYVAAFGEGGADSRGVRKNSISAWLDRLLFNEIIPQSVVPLVSWWNQDFGDNYATTKPSWSDWLPSSIVWQDGCRHIRNDELPDGTHVYQKRGYLLYRMEGYVFDPLAPQPSGTVPLFSWWFPDVRDNYATTHPGMVMNPLDVVWNGEDISNGLSLGSTKMYRLEGFVFDPGLPQPPDTVPLFEWFNSDSGDHFTSSDTYWSVPIQAVDIDSETHAVRDKERFRKRGYVPDRLAGYVYPPLVY